MSGLDALQAATSALALAELARQTALLLRKVYKAHKDADQLCQKTKNLSQLVKNVNRVLERRQTRRGSRVIEPEEQELEDNIKSSLALCRKCLESLHATFKMLTQEDPALSSIQLRERLKFVMKQNYIANQERDISMHLSTLSVGLHCLNTLDQLDYRDTERQQREEFARQQQDAQDKFLQQLLVLFQFVFNCTETGSSAPPGPASRVPQTGRPTSATFEEIDPRDKRAITNEDAQTLQDLFGVPVNRRSSFESFNFDPDRAANQAPMAEVENLQLMDINPLRDSGVGEDLEVLERPVSMDMTFFAEETTFLLAIKRGESELVRSLIREGVDATATDVHGWTQLHHAVFRSHVEIVQTLLSEPRCTTAEYLNAQTKTTKETALIFAVQRAHRKEGFLIAQMLLKQHHCDVNISDGHGTALFYAVHEGKPSSRPRRSLVQSIAEKGADIQEVQDRIPDQVSDYEFLYRYMRVIDERRESEDSAAAIGNQHGRTTSLTVIDRRESGASQNRRSPIKRLFSRTRTRSNSGTGSLGSTPPQ